MRIIGSGHPERLMVAMTKQEKQQRAQDLTRRLQENAADNDYLPYEQQGFGPAAEFLVELVSILGAGTLVYADLDDPETVFFLGSVLQNGWLVRNQWVHDEKTGRPDLAQPFAGLAPQERGRIMNQLLVVQGWLTDMLD